MVLTSFWVGRWPSTYYWFWMAKDVVLFTLSEPSSRRRPCAASSQLPAASDAVWVAAPLGGHHAQHRALHGRASPESLRLLPAGYMVYKKKGMHYM